MSINFLDEPERYELKEGPSYVFEMSRRDFARFGVAGIVVVIASGSLRAQETPAGLHFEPRPIPTDVSAWLHIDEKGTVTGRTGKVEIGQNIRTSLAQAIADELRIPLTTVTMIMGDTDLTPWDILTAGSMTTRGMGPVLRRAAAAARQMLLELAAERWTVPAQELVVERGAVSHKSSGRTASFGDLTRGKQLVRSIPMEQPVTPPGQWTVAGTAIAKVDGAEIVTGRMKYASDIKRPGMLYGKIVRPPAMGAALISVNDAEARRLPRVTVVQDRDFVGVVAERSWTADAAARAIKATWGPAESLPSSKTIFEYLKSSAEKRRPRSATLEQALASAAHRVTRAYTIAYIAHVPLEPRAAVAEWNGQKLTVWTGTQGPFSVQKSLSETFRIPLEQVRVIVPPFGSGYGGKHTSEFAIEAARLSKAVGKPVNVTWTRGEEFQWAYFRAGGVIEVDAAINNDGVLTAWDFITYHAGQSASGTIYEVPDPHVQYVTSKPPLRSGSYRGLAAVANNFAREAHMSELAAAARLDPLAFRLKNLKEPRARAVLEAAAERFGWGRRSPRPGYGAGLAVGVEKGGYVGTCVEIRTSAGSEPKLSRIVVAYECGAVVNPQGLENQVVGGIIQAIGGALFEAVDFADGKVLNGSLRQYRVPRFADIPPIEFVMLNRKDLPSAGAGETPMIALAPAIAGAIFEATGERRSSLPLAARS